MEHAQDLYFGMPGITSNAEYPTASKNKFKQEYTKCDFKWRKKKLMLLFTTFTDT